MKKEKKKVMFKESENVEFSQFERKWNDKKGNKANMVTGKFTVPEIRAIMDSLC